MALWDWFTVRQLVADIRSLALQEGFNRFLLVDESGSLLKCPSIVDRDGADNTVVARGALGLNLFVTKHKKVVWLYRNHPTLWREMVMQNILHEVGHQTGFDISAISRLQVRSGLDPNSEQAVDWQESQANLFPVARMGLRAAALATWFQWLYPHPEYQRRATDVVWLRENTEEYLGANYKWLRPALFDRIFVLVREINSEVASRAGRLAAGRGKA